MENIVIKKVDEIDEYKKRIISEIFVDAFYQRDFYLLDKDKNKVFKVFYNSFKYNFFYIVYFEDNPVGVFALTDGRDRFVKFNLKNFINTFGFIKGIISYLFMKNEFEKRIDLLKHGLYVDIIAVKPDFQGKGVGKEIVRYIKNISERENIHIELDVNDTNSKAFNLYSKEGFRIIKKIPIFLLRKLKGFNKKIRMAYN